MEKKPDMDALLRRALQSDETPGVKLMVSMQRKEKRTRAPLPRRVLGVALTALLVLVCGLGTLFVTGALQGRKATEGDVEVVVPPEEETPRGEPFYFDDIIPTTPNNWPQGFGARGDYNGPYDEWELPYTDGDGVAYVLSRTLLYDAAHMPLFRTDAYYLADENGQVAWGAYPNIVAGVGSSAFSLADGLLYYENANPAWVERYYAPLNGPEYMFEKRINDERGVALTEIGYDAQGKETKRVESTYNIDRLETGRSVYVYGALLYRFAMQYDSAGNESQRTYYDADGVMVYRDVISYKIVSTWLVPVRDEAVYSEDAPVGGDYTQGTWFYQDGTPATFLELPIYERTKITRYMADGKVYEQYGMSQWNVRHPWYEVADALVIADSPINPFAPIPPEVCESLFAVMRDSIAGYPFSDSIWFCVTYRQKTVYLTDAFTRQSGFRSNTDYDGGFSIEQMKAQIDMWLTMTLADGSERTENLDVQAEDGMGGWCQMWIDLGPLGGPENIQAASLRVVFGGMGEREDIVMEVPDAWERYHNNWYDAWLWLTPKAADLTEELDAALRALLQEQLGVDAQMFWWIDYVADEFVAPVWYADTELVWALRDANRITAYGYIINTGSENRCMQAVLGLFNGEWRIVGVVDVME
ncbi:MAG: hypothetical protein FWF10_01140 [Clostridiales bacterium]|nr:hypothetical protein [Clostridiales bacterium]